jgi:dolichyl-phosphate beta-glucosyltransferase
MSKSPIILSVVVPAYNEELRLQLTLERIIAFLTDETYSWEILVINDGSTDETAKVAELVLASIGDKGRVLHNPGNRGKGYSVRAGMLEAHGKWILMSDADLSTPIEEVSLLMKASEKYDVVIGSRGLKESQLEERQPLYRETMGRIFNILVQIMALPGIRDSQCGFKLFRQDVAKAVFSRTTIDGFGFDVESLFLAQRLGFSIGEVPIRWVNHPASKVHAIRDSARMAADLVRIRLNHRKISETKE